MPLVAKCRDVGSQCGHRLAQLAHLALELNEARLRISRVGRRRVVDLSRGGLRGVAADQLPKPLLLLARHEQGAGFMADGYARASGKPGVAFIITGPGITNVATPIGFNTL